MMVASMFVLSAAMVRTGAAQLLGGRLLAAGAGSELRFQLTVLVLVTAVQRRRQRHHHRAGVDAAGDGDLPRTRLRAVARADAARVRLAARRAMDADRHAQQRDPVRLPAARTARAWLLRVHADRRGGVRSRAHLVRRWSAAASLPAAGAEATLESRYEVAEFLTETMAEPGSSFVGKTLAELDLPAQRHHRAAGDPRQGVPAAGGLAAVQPQRRAGDAGPHHAITDALQQGLQVKEELKVDDKTLRSADLRMVEAILPPDSEFDAPQPARPRLPPPLRRQPAGDQPRRPLAARPTARRAAARRRLAAAGRPRGRTAAPAPNPTCCCSESQPLPTVAQARRVAGARH
jgi:hypothetical protein